jgi:hypothetical protein
VKISLISVICVPLKIKHRFNKLNTQIEQMITDYYFIDIRNKSGRWQQQVAAGGR